MKRILIFLCIVISLIMFSLLAPKSKVVRSKTNDTPEKRYLNNFIEFNLLFRFIDWMKGVKRSDKVNVEELF